MKKWLNFFKLLIYNGKIRQKPFDFDEFKSRVIKGSIVKNRLYGPSKVIIKDTFLKAIKRYPLVWTIVQNIALFKNSLLNFDFQVLTVKKLKLIYFRVPKAGSTSQLAALIRKIHPGIEVDYLSVDEINVLGEGLLANKLPEGHEGFFKYGIVRNPFARLVSFYLTYFNGNEDEFIFQNYLFGILKPHDTFSDLVDKITFIPDVLKDPHFKPQHKLLGMEFYQDIFWVKLENLDQDFKEIRAHFQLETPLLNQSPGYNISEFYNNDILEKVYQIYQKDIEIFDYRKEYHELKQKIFA